MHLSLSNPSSINYARVRYLLAMWCKPGIAWLGGESPIIPIPTCCILLETGSPDEILLEDGTGCIALEGC